eukprot:scaffold108654_cov17-Prasinocladus_malaysianus.AAC.1
MRPCAYTCNKVNSTKASLAIESCGCSKHSVSQQRRLNGFGSVLTCHTSVSPVALTGRACVLPA